MFDSTQNRIMSTNNENMSIETPHRLEEGQSRLAAAAKFEEFFNNPNTSATSGTGYAKKRPDIVT